MGRGPGEEHRSAVQACDTINGALALPQLPLALLVHPGCGCKRPCLVSAVLPHVPPLLLAQAAAAHGRMTHSDKVGEPVCLEEARYYINTAYDILAGQVRAGIMLSCWLLIAPHSCRDTHCCIDHNAGARHTCLLQLLCPQPPMAPLFTGTRVCPSQVYGTGVESCASAACMCCAHQPLHQLLLLVIVRVFAHRDTSLPFQPQLPLRSCKGNFMHGAQRGSLCAPVKPLTLMPSEMVACGLRKIPSPFNAAPSHGPLSCAACAPHSKTNCMPLTGPSCLCAYP